MVNNVNGLMNSLYSMGSVGSVSSNTYDYKAAQRENQAILETYQQGKSQVKSLKSESTKFLNDFTAGMKKQNDASTKLLSGNIDKLLYDKNGEVTEDTVKATVDATQKMVDAHNANLKLLNDNADRGAGVTKQMARMVDDPAAKSTMDMVGMTMNKDGTLSLDQEKLTAALNTTSGDQLNLYKDILGGYNGIAANLQRDASAGLNTSASSLINNDIAKMQSIQSDTSIKSQTTSQFEGFSQMFRMGAYGLSNMGVVGMMMNFTA